MCNFKVWIWLAIYCMQTTASVEVHQEERTGEQGKRMNMFSSLRNQKVRIWACTLKFPSLCHGHSVKGPGLVAMATLPSLWSLCLTSRPHLPLFHAIIPWLAKHQPNLALPTASPFIPVLREAVREA